MKSTDEPARGFSSRSSAIVSQETGGPVGAGTYDPETAERLRKEDETLEPLLRGRGWILQKRHGYRFSLDALLLAWLVTVRHPAARERTGIRYLDLGTGSGIVPILLAKWHLHLTGQAVEIQEPLAAMAARNMRLHGLENRFQILRADLKELPSRLSRGAFDWITINPPYRKLCSGRVNPDPQKAVARHELAATLRQICSVMGFLLRQKGRAFLIYPAGRLTGLFAELQGAGLTPKYLRPVYPKPGEQACWVLVEAVRGGGEDLQVDVPLWIEDERGGDSEELQQIFGWCF
jgi:tRNA1Val (adenine37-N6)-methyltransferase